MNRCTVLVAAVVLLSAGVADAQQWQIVETFPGRPAGTSFFSPNNVELIVKVRDFTGDGVPDQSFIPSDFPVLIIQDGADSTNSFSIDHGPLAARLAGLSVIGYYELAGSNNFKEIVLAGKKGRSYVDPIVIDINGAVVWDGNNKLLLTIADMDGDACDEIVVGNPAVPQVEIWGEKKN